MTETEELIADGYLNHSDNSVLASKAAAAQKVNAEEESKKEKKKRKKKQKKAEELERKAMHDKMDAAHPRLDAALVPVVVAHTEEKGGGGDKSPHPLRMQAWLRPVAHTLDTHRVLTANKSSFLIGINCVMLSIAAHALYSQFNGGPLQWALIPLALTNLLSLTFAVFSAKDRQKPTALDELFAMPADEFDPAVAAMLKDKQRVYATLSQDLHLVGADLNQRQRHLRTAYNVLLGGVALSTCLFAICVALGTRAS